MYDDSCGFHAQNPLLLMGGTRLALTVSHWTGSEDTMEADCFLGVFGTHPVCLNRMGIILNVLAGFIFAPGLIGSERIRNLEVRAGDRVERIIDEHTRSVTNRDSFDEMLLDEQHLLLLAVFADFAVIGIVTVLIRRLHDRVNQLNSIPYTNHLLFQLFLGFIVLCLLWISFPFVMDHWLNRFDFMDYLDFVEDIWMDMLMWPVKLLILLNFYLTWIVFQFAQAASWLLGKYDGMDTYLLLTGIGLFFVGSVVQFAATF